MEKDNKLVYDYINGEYIDEEILNNLENNRCFMREVIKLTNDKRMYDFCSEELKKDYTFGKFLIFKFNDDISFIDKVATNILNSNINDKDRNELCIIMSNFTKCRDNNCYLKYSLMLTAIYNTTRVEIEIFKTKENNDRLRSKLGMGFLFMYDDFSDSDITLEYYASNLINDIFMENNIDLISLIHSKFNTFDMLESYGIRKFLIDDVIRLYDSFLADYIQLHTHLLNDLYDVVRRMKDTYDDYSCIIEKRFFDNLIDEVYDYVSNNCESYSNIGFDYIFYVGMELGINDKLKKYLKYEEVDYNNIMELIKVGYYDNNTGIIKMNDVLHARNIRKIVMNAFRNNDKVRSFNKNLNGDTSNIGVKKCSHIKNKILSFKKM